MGRALVEAVQQQDDSVLAGALERADSEFLGIDAGGLAGIGRQNVPLVADISELGGFEVLIDFTRPEATLANVQACRALGARVVIGTTGLSPEQRETVVEASGHIPIVMAPNMSVGVNLCFKLQCPAA